MASPVEQAKDLLSLVAAPSALASGTLLVLATKAIRNNQARAEPKRMVGALLAAVAALAISGALVGLMTPLAMRSLFVYRGSVEAALIVFWIVFLSIIGASAYSVLAAFRCVKELKRPSR